MARTIDEIFDEMIATKEEISDLDQLTSNSRAAVWRLLFYICAVSISIVENLFDLLVEQVNIKADSIIAGTLNWYADQTKLYQHGDTLIYNAETGYYGYATNEPDLQIVKLAACSDDTSGAVFIKAAKIDESTQTAEPLTTAELNGLIGYWDLKKFAGTNLTVSSEEPDKIHLAYRITYDATVLTEYGELLSDTDIKPVEQTIYEFLYNFSQTSFDGVFKLSELTRALLNTTGVLNAVCTTATARRYDDTYETDILADDDQQYQTYAGYMVVDPNYPLENYLLYIAGA